MYIGWVICQSRYKGILWGGLYWWPERSPTKPDGFAFILARHLCWLPYCFSPDPQMCLDFCISFFFVFLSFDQMAAFILDCFSTGQILAPVCQFFVFSFYFVFCCILLYFAVFCCILLYFVVFCCILLYFVVFLCVFVFWPAAGWWWPRCSLHV